MDTIVEGSRVRVMEPNTERYNQVGVVTNVDLEDGEDFFPYSVTFPDGEWQVYNRDELALVE
jgi:hypothetical protein